MNPYDDRICSHSIRTTGVRATSMHPKSCSEMRKYVSYDDSGVKNSDIDSDNTYSYYRDCNSCF